MDDVLRRVLQVMAEWCGPATAGLGPDTQLTELSLDSLTLLEVSLGLQKEFSVTVGDEQMAQAATVMEIVGLVRAALAEA